MSRKSCIIFCVNSDKYNICKKIDKNVNEITVFYSPNEQHANTLQVAANIFCYFITNNYILVKFFPHKT